MLIERKEKRVIVNIIVIAIVIIFAFINLSNLFNLSKHLIDVFKPILFGFAIAFVVNIFMSFFERTLFHKVKKHKRTCAVLFSLLVIAIFTTVFILFVFPRLFEAFEILIPKVITAVIQIFEYLNNLFSKKEFAAFASNIGINLDSFEKQSIEFLSSLVTRLSQNIIVSASSIYNFFYNFIFGFVFALYMLGCKEQILSFLDRLLKAFSSDTAYANVKVVVTTANESFSSFIKGQSLECIIIGSSLFVVMGVLNFPNTLLLSFIITVCAFIPIFGAVFALVIGYFLTAIFSFSQANLFLLIYLVIQQIEGNFIYPKIVGTSVGLPGVLVLASIAIFGSLFGFLGLLIAVPTTATLYKLVKILMEIKLAAKN